MSKIWEIGSKDDTLQFTVVAPNWETALKLVEGLVGPINANRRTVKELPAIPEGFKLPADASPQILEEDA